MSDDIVRCCRIMRKLMQISASALPSLNTIDALGIIFTIFTILETFTIVAQQVNKSNISKHLKISIMVVCHTMIPPYSPFGVQIREIHMFVNLSDIQIFQIFSRYSPVCLSLRYSSKTQSTVKRRRRFTLAT